MKYILIPFLLLNCSFLFAQDFSKFRLSLGYGMGYRLAKAALGIDANYIKDLRLGEEINADATYFTGSLIGVGLKYSYFLSGASSPGLMSNVRIHYIGPIFYNRLRLNSERSKLLVGASIGYINYQEDAWVNTQNLLTTGNTIGALIELAYDYRIFKGLHIGANTGLSGGSISKVKLNGEKRDLGDNKEGLTRASFGIGLRYWIH